MSVNEKVLDENQKLVKKVRDIKKLIDTGSLLDPNNVTPHMNVYVQLHIHFGGSVKPETLWSIMKRRNIDLNIPTLEELKKALISNSGISLEEFLKPFSIISKVLAGDCEALKQVAREFVQRMSEENILYVELRYGPYGLVGFEDTSLISAEDVVFSIQTGLKDGEAKYPGTTIRSILICLRDDPSRSNDIVDLCDKFRHLGVVGIDLAGSESAGDYEDHVSAFQRAKQLGIHRTVHAGESGPPENVRKAIELLSAERIGHGYSCVADVELLEKIKREKIHLEMCTISCVMTGNFTRYTNSIKRLAHDSSLLYSISTDDPTLTDCNLKVEYMFCQMQLEFSIDMIVRANLMAIDAAFIDDKTKQNIKDRLLEIYALRKQ